MASKPERREGERTMAERRGPQRRGIALRAELADPAGLTCAATITDISEEGCTIRDLSARELVRDQLYSIKVTGLEAIAGHARWSGRGRAGIAFSPPLASATVQTMVMKSLYARLSRRAEGGKPDDPPTRRLPPFPFDD